MIVKVLLCYIMHELFRSKVLSDHMRVHFTVYTVFCCVCCFCFILYLGIYFSYRENEKRRVFVWISWVMHCFLTLNIYLSCELTSNLNPISHRSPPPLPPYNHNHGLENQSDAHITNILVNIIIWKKTVSFRTIFEF